MKGILISKILSKSSTKCFDISSALDHEANHYKNYTTAQEFIEHLNVNRESKLSKEQFVNMVGSLRDKGILIGSSRKGYKIPVNHKEIKKYVQHGNSIVLPMLRRISLCRESILLATNKYHSEYTMKLITKSQHLRKEFRLICFDIRSKY